MIVWYVMLQYAVKYFISAMNATAGDKNTIILADVVPQRGHTPHAADNTKENSYSSQRHSTERTYSPDRKRKDRSRSTQCACWPKQAIPYEWSLLHANFINFHKQPSRIMHNSFHFEKHFNCKLWYSLLQLYCYNMCMTLMKDITADYPAVLHSHPAETTTRLF